jgi:hypothetical protein
MKKPLSIQIPIARVDIIYKFNLFFLTWIAMAKFGEYL